MGWTSPYTTLLCLNPPCDVNYILLHSNCAAALQMTGLSLSNSCCIPNFFNLEESCKTTLLSTIQEAIRGGSFVNADDKPIFDYAIRNEKEEVVSLSFPGSSRRQITLWSKYAVGRCQSEVFPDTQIPLLRASKTDHKVALIFNFFNQVCSLPSS